MITASFFLGGVVGSEGKLSRAGCLSALSLLVKELGCGSDPWWTGLAQQRQENHRQGERGPQWWEVGPQRQEKLANP